MNAAIPYPDPPLLGTTFVLRPFRAADFPRARALESGDEALPWLEPLPAADGQSMERAAEQARQEGAVLQLVIADLASSAYLGEVSLVLLEPGTAEVGCAVIPEARGRHLASEALSLVSAWALEALGLRRLQAMVEIRNGAALKLAENAGFRREGVLRSYWDVDGELLDAVLLSRLPGDAAE